MEKIFLKFLINSLLSILLVQSQTQERIPQQWLNQVIETKPHPIHCHKVSDDVPITNENSAGPVPYVYNNQVLQRPNDKVYQNLVALNPVNTLNPVSSGPHFERSIDFQVESSPHYVDDVRRNNDAQAFLGEEPRLNRRKVQNTNMNISPSNAVADTKVLSARQGPQTTVPEPEEVPITPTPVICVKESKVLQIATEPLRRNFDGSNTEDEVEAREPNSQQNARPYPKPKLISCYACSNMTNEYCNEPVNGITTIKYCSTLCIKKVINARGTPVLVRDCGPSCETKYSNGDVNKCNVCNTELCNGAFSILSGPTLFNTICSFVVLLGVKLV